MKGQHPELNKDLIMDSESNLEMGLILLVTIESFLSLSMTIFKIFLLSPLTISLT